MWLIGPIKDGGLRRTIVGALAAGLLISGPAEPIAAVTALPQIPAPIEGTWLMDKGAELTVTPCGSAYCGTMSWIVIPKEHSAACLADKDSFGAQMLDYKNPDKNLKSRSLIGMLMATIKPTTDPARYDVHLYSAEDGKSYDGAAYVDGRTLNLQQCLGICVTVRSWPRIPTREATGFSCG
jgi:uncharacterized protein (DUF2147 family)